MKKTKRLLSALTALTITASAFAGLAIPASAASTSIASYNFEDEVVWAESGSHTAQYETDIVSDTTLNSKVLHTALNNQTGGRKVTLGIPSTITPTTDVVKVDFDWYSKTVGAKNSTDTVLVGSSDVQIFSISDVVDTGKVTFNGKDTGLTAGWYKVSAVLDFETKQVITISFTPNGSDTPTKTISNVDFINQTATDIAGLYLQANRTNNITLDWRMDNFDVSSVTDEHYKATVTVKTKTDEPVADATLTIGDAAFTTDANGQVVVKLPIGEYQYKVTKSGYEATEGQEDDATGTITITNADVPVNVTFSPQVYTPVPGTVTMAGGQKVMTAPHTAASTTSAAYTLTVIDQKNVPITDAQIDWTILPTGSETADEKVTIADGVITVANGFTAGETHVKDFTVTATVTKNGESKSATASVAISDYLFYEPGIGGSSYGSTNTAMLNTNGTNEGTDSFIATPNIKNHTDTITLPDPIVFKNGTAQLLSFKTTVQNKTGYTYERTVAVMNGETPIISFGYINLDIGDSATADWSTSSSTFKTTWGSISALNSWTDVTVLFKTNSNGVTKMIYTVAGNEYEAETTATGVSAINLTQNLNNVDRYALLKDIIISEVDVTGMEVDGPVEFSSIANQTVTKEYAVDAMVIEDGEEFEWSTDIAGATITADPTDSQKATLSVPGTVTEGGKVSVKSKEGTATKPKNASLDVTIEPAEIKSAKVSGSATLDKTAGTAEYTVSDVIDQFGDDVTEYFTPAWSVVTAAADVKASFTVNAAEAGTATAVKAVYNTDGTLKSVTTEDVTLKAGEQTVNVSAPAGAKVMLWDKLNGMKPVSNEVKTAEVEEVSNASIDQEGTLTITDNGDVKVKATFTHGTNTYDFTKDVKIATFSVVADATGASTPVDISELVTDNAITGYQVTTATADGAKVNSTTVAKEDVADNTITVDTTGAAKVEVAPVFAGAMGKEFTVPADSYNITVTASNGARTDVYVNDQMVFNNINQGGDNWTIARTIAASTDYTAGDVVISGGSAVFKYADDKSNGTTITNVKFSKSPSIVERATRVYVIGDSLTAKYYGTAPEGKGGLVRTGWGDVLGDYMAEGVEVTNLGNSGAWAEGMLNDAFTNVKQSGKPGDILVLESGYNDSSHTSMQVMRDSVKAMVKGAEANGMKVFVVTPNASSHSGNEYIGSVKSTGDMIKAYNELKDEGSNAVLIDLAAKSGFFFKSYYGDAAYAGDTPSIPEATLATLTAIYNNAGDSLHSSYNAANCWAAVVANGIYENTDTAALVDATHTYTFNDGTNSITVSATQISNPSYTENNIEFTESEVTVTRPNGTAITKAAAGDTVKVVPADTTKTVEVSGVTVTYNETTKAYYFVMPAQNVTITVTTPSTGGDTDEGTGDNTGDNTSEGNGTDAGADTPTA